MTKTFWADTARTNQWRLSGELPGSKRTGEMLAKMAAAQKKKDNSTGRDGLNSTAQQVAYRTRADQNLRKFSWEQ